MWTALRRLFQSKPDRQNESPSEQMTRACYDLLCGHGLHCRLQDGWIIAEDGCLRAQAEISRNHPLSCQFDFEAHDRLGNIIVESCAGFGDTPGAQMNDALLNFCNGSFHVIFSALSGKACSHCFEEEWQFADRKRKVYLSPVTVRGQLPESTEWWIEMQKAIEAMDFQDKRHWIRCYHAHMPGGNPIYEALLNNDYCESLQQRLAMQSWPDTSVFYSVRVFMIIDP